MEAVPSPARRAYPSDGHDDEWAFVAPSLTLMTEDAPPRDHALREVFNGLRWLGRTGAQWRMLPHDLPPWSTVSQQTQRWLAAGVFEAIAQDLRRLLREAAGRAPRADGGDPRRADHPVHARERGWRRLRRAQAAHGAHGAHGPHSRGYAGPPAGAGGHARQRQERPANEQARAQVAELAARVQVQAVTGDTVRLAFVDQGSTGQQPAQDTAAHGIRLEVVKLPEAKRGFVLPPRRWVIERSTAWAARFRRLARDYEPLPETLAGLHFLAFTILLLSRFAALMTERAYQALAR